MHFKFNIQVRSLKINRKIYCYQTVLSYFIMGKIIEFCILKFMNAKKPKKKNLLKANKVPSSQGYGFSSGHVWM